MQWIYLLIAGAFEVTWAVALKMSHGFSVQLPSIITIVGMAASLFFLGLALRDLPIGVAYAIWTGLGIMGTFIFSAFVFHEIGSPGQWVCVGLIASGIAGLKLLSH